MLFHVYSFLLLATCCFSGLVTARSTSLKKDPSVVVINADKAQLIDAVGKPIPKPFAPAHVASPINLLNPDKYEFYTFDENGELIKRLMTMEEIQSIVANGDSEGNMVVHGSQTDSESEDEVKVILESLKDVLSKEMEKNTQKNNTNKPILDTPDVSSNWSIILPAIFGNTGEQIIPQTKIPSISMTPESEIIDITTRSPTKRPKPSRTPAPAVSTVQIVSTHEIRIPTPSPTLVTKPKLPTSTYGPPTPVELKNNFPIFERPQTTNPPKVPLSSTLKTTRPPIKIASSGSFVKATTSIPLKVHPVELRQPDFPALSQSTTTSSTTTESSTSTTSSTTRTTTPTTPTTTTRWTTTSQPTTTTSRPTSLRKTTTTTTQEPSTTTSPRTTTTPITTTTRTTSRRTTPSTTTQRTTPVTTTSTTTTTTTTTTTNPPPTTTTKTTPPTTTTTSSTTPSTTTTSTTPLTTTTRTTPSTTTTSTTPPTTTTRTTPSTTTTTTTPSSTSASTTTTPLTTTPEPETTTADVAHWSTVPLFTKTSSSNQMTHQRPKPQMTPVEDNPIKEESMEGDSLKQIIQALQNPKPTPEATTSEQTEDTSVTVLEMESTTPEIQYLIPVEIHPDEVLVKIAQNMGLGLKSPVKPSAESNLATKPNKIFTNNPLFVDEPEPEIHEIPTTTENPIFSQKEGIVQRVDQYIASHVFDHREPVSVDPVALPLVSEKFGSFVTELRKNLTTLGNESSEVVESTSGYNLLEESLTGILNQVSDDRPHSVPLVEDHRIESKIKVRPNSEELTVDEELDKLEDDTDDEDDAVTDEYEKVVGEESNEDEKFVQVDLKESDDFKTVFEEESKLNQSNKTDLNKIQDNKTEESHIIKQEDEDNMERVATLNEPPKNGLPPTKVGETSGSSEKFHELESLSLILETLNENNEDDNTLMESSTTTEEVFATTTEQVYYVTSIVKETHSVSAHQEKPVNKPVQEVVSNSLDKDVINDLTLEGDFNLNESVSTKDDPIFTTTEEEEIPETTTEFLKTTTDQSKDGEFLTTSTSFGTTTEDSEDYTSTTTTFSENPTTNPSFSDESAESLELKESLQIFNLKLEQFEDGTTVESTTVDTERPTTEFERETTTEEILDITTEFYNADTTTELSEPTSFAEPKLPSEILRKADDSEIGLTINHPHLPDETEYEKLGEPTTDSVIETVYTILGETTTEADVLTTEIPTTEEPETTTEIVQKAIQKYKPNVKLASATLSLNRPSGGYKDSLGSAIKRPASVFHVKTNVKPAVKIENRVAPTRKPVKLQSAPKDALGLEQSTAGLDSDSQDFTKLCNELAFSYWTALQAEGVSASRSLLVSPFALTSMLSMVFLGARGATSGEMNEILKLDDMVTFNPHLVFRNITDSIGNLRENGVYSSAMVRELFSDRSKGKLLPFYKEKAQQFYSGYVEEVNFNVINDIVRRRTNLLIKRNTWGKVMEYLRTNSLLLKSPLAAVSANVFQTDCIKGSVADRDGEIFFQMEPVVKQRKLTPLPAVVFRSGFTAGYDGELDATVVALGNSNNVISTVFVMPGQQGHSAPGDSLDRLESAFLQNGVNSWRRLLTTLMERSDLEVQIPKFYHRSFVNGTNLMQRMGLKELFDSSKSDLRGLTSNANQDIFLADLLQINTFGTCGDDKGTESHYKEVYPSPPNQKYFSFPKMRKLKLQNPYISSLPDNIKNKMFEGSSKYANEDSMKYIEYQRALFDPFYDTKYMELPLPLRPRQARIPEAPRLRFDKPFLYFVRHNPTGMILYMGRFNPRIN